MGAQQGRRCWRVFSKVLRAANLNEVHSLLLTCKISALFYFSHSWSHCFTYSHRTTSEKTWKTQPGTNPDRRVTRDLISVTDKSIPELTGVVQTVAFWCVSNTTSLCFSSGSVHWPQVAWKWQYTAFPQRDSTKGIFSFHVFFAPRGSRNDAFMP